MSLWITVYCRASTLDVTPQQLLDGIRGRDPSALAGVDYQTLAEDYGVDDSLAKESISALRVAAPDDGCDGYTIVRGGLMEVIHVRRWRDPDRVMEEIAEAVTNGESNPAPAVIAVKSSCEVVGIELRPHQLEDMSVVVAYEVARYVAQKGHGVIWTDEGRWLRVVDGIFDEIK